jgi:type I restriction enzyme S subunit
MNSWENITLGKFITIQRGHDLTADERKKGVVPVYGAAGQNGFHNTAKAKAPGVVIGRSGGSFGKVCFVDQDFWPHNTALYVTDFHGNDPNFVYYFLKNLDLSVYNSGSAQPSLNRNFIYPIKIRVPNKKNQKLIGRILRNLDSKIELNNRINAELEAIAKLIYDYWFVQFDFPDANGKPYKSSGGKMVFNHELKREIPEGWEMKTLAEVSSLLVRGVSPKYVEEDGILVLNQKCIRNKSINFTFSRRHDHESKSASSKLLKVYDILVNSTGVGTLGRVALVKYLEEHLVTVDSHVSIVRIDERKANKLFAGYTLTQKQSEIEQLGEGSTGQTELSRENLGKLNILLPPDKLQLAFEGFLKPQLQKMANNDKENKQLTELRDWLLPMLMNGQVTVGEAEEKVAMAAEAGATYGEQVELKF